VDVEVERLMEDHQEVGDRGRVCQLQMEGPRSVRLWAVGDWEEYWARVCLRSYILQCWYRAGMGLNNQYWYVSMT
jgi:hypothetical protein